MVDTHRQWSYLVVYGSMRRLVTLVLVIFILILQSTFSRLHRHLYVFFSLVFMAQNHFLIHYYCSFTLCLLLSDDSTVLLPHSNIFYFFFFEILKFPSFCVHNFAFYCQFPLLCVAALLPVDCLCSVLQ